MMTRIYSRCISEISSSLLAKNASILYQENLATDDLGSDSDLTLTPGSTHNGVKTHDISLSFPAFTLFNNLPLELRYLVWEYALPDARLIQVEARPIGTYNPYDPSWSRSGIFFHSDAFNPPALLSACRESREIALAAFQICFYATPDSINIRDEVLITNPPVWFQPERGTIYLTDEVDDGYMSNLLQSNIGSLHCETVRYLAVDECVWDKVGEDLVCETVAISGDRRRSSWVEGFGHPPPFRALCNILLVVDEDNERGIGFLEAFRAEAEQRIQLATTLKKMPTWDVVYREDLPSWIEYNWPACTYSLLDDF
jgi:hypothetical protein